MSNIPLIYNPQTTHVSLQYHIVFDEDFTSITAAANKTHDKFFEDIYNNASWVHESPYSASAEEYYFDSFWMDPPLAPHPENRGRKRKTILTRGSNSTQSSPQPITKHEGVTCDSSHITPLWNKTIKGDPSTPTNLIEASFDTSKTSNINGPSTKPYPFDPSINDSNFSNEVTNTSQQGEKYSELSNKDDNQMPYSNNSISSRRHQYNIFHGSTSFQSAKRQKGLDGNIYVPPSTNIGNTTSQTDLRSLPNIMPHVLATFYDLPVVPSELTLSAFMALNNKDDTLTQSQMLKTTDSPDFIAAQAPEIRGLEKMNVFDYQTIETLPAKARLLSSIWSYRRKRRPNGELLKHKARICVDGSQQLFGRDFWETYAPVVTWSTIRLILLLSTILNLKSRQVNYTQAFPQADLTDPVFMKLPQGWFLDSTSQTLQQHKDPKFNDTSHYIKLKKNLYGCKQAARNWYQCVNQGIIAEGFYQSKTDPCLYLRHDCIIVLYTDDTLIFAPDDSIIDSVIQNLSKTFTLEDQGNVQDFLGIRIHKDHTSKTIHMTQPGLIESIINDVGIKDTSNTKFTPSDSILYADKSNTPREDNWNYRSIIGKLNFLAQNTRPDLSFAVHQCARFCTKPTKLHEIAIKRIVRYLLLTKDKGLILQPTKTFTLDMYVDADFAGMWHQEHSALRENVLSRTGYVITYCGCPIHWVSKLQNEIALSTTESEYIALSMATRDLLPLWHILQEIHQHSLINTPLPHEFNTTKTSTLAATQVFEDNAACIILAHSESNKVRTKHIAIKWHHFRDQIRSGHIKVIKIDTHHNWADIFTKPLG